MRPGSCFNESFDGAVYDNSDIPPMVIEKEVPPFKLHEAARRLRMQTPLLDIFPSDACVLISGQYDERNIQRGFRVEVIGLADTEVGSQHGKNHFQELRVLKDFLGGSFQLSDPFDETVVGKVPGGVVSSLCKAVWRASARKYECLGHGPSSAS